MELVRDCMSWCSSVLAVTRSSTWRAAWATATAVDANVSSRYLRPDMTEATRCSRGSV